MTWRTLFTLASAVACATNLARADSDSGHTQAGSRACITRDRTSCLAVPWSDEAKGIAVCPRVKDGVPFPVTVTNFNFLAYRLDVPVAADELRSFAFLETLWGQILTPASADRGVAGPVQPIGGVGKRDDWALLLATPSDAATSGLQGAAGAVLCCKEASMAQGQQTC